MVRSEYLPKSAWIDRACAHQGLSVDSAEQLLVSGTIPTRVQDGELFYLWQTQQAMGGMQFIGTATTRILTSSSTETSTVGGEGSGQAGGSGNGHGHEISSSQETLVVAPLEEGSGSGPGGGSGSGDGGEISFSQETLVMGPALAEEGNDADV